MRFSFEGRTLLGISTHIRINVFRNGHGVQKDVFLHLDNGVSVRYRYLDSDCSSGYGKASYVTVKSMPTPSYCPFHYRPINTVWVQQRPEEAWNIVYAEDRTCNDSVDILRYTTKTCEWYPVDALMLLLESEPSHMFVCSARTKTVRQRYACVHSGFPKVFNVLLSDVPTGRMYGLLQDVEWISCPLQVEHDEQSVTVLVTLKGEGQTLILEGPPGIGKSHLAQLLTRFPAGLDSPYDGEPSSSMTVLETDGVHTLPDVISEDIVVLGCRHLIVIDDIICRIPGGKAMVGTLSEINP